MVHYQDHDHVDYVANELEARLHAHAMEILIVRAIRYHQLTQLSYSLSVMCCAHRCAQPTASYRIRDHVLFLVHEFVFHAMPVR